MLWLRFDGTFLNSLQWQHWVRFTKDATLKQVGFQSERKLPQSSTRLAGKMAERVRTSNTECRKPCVRSKNRQLNVVTKVVQHIGQQSSSTPIDIKLNGNHRCHGTKTVPTPKLGGLLESQMSARNRHNKKIIEKSRKPNSWKSYHHGFLRNHIHEQANFCGHPKFHLKHHSRIYSHKQDVIQNTDL